MTCHSVVASRLLDGRSLAALGPSSFFSSRRDDGDRDLAGADRSPTGLLTGMGGYTFDVFFVSAIPSDGVITAVVGLLPSRGGGGLRFMVPLLGGAVLSRSSAVTGGAPFLRPSSKGFLMLLGPAALASRATCTTLAMSSSSHQVCESVLGLGTVERAMRKDGSSRYPSVETQT